MSTLLRARVRQAIWVAFVGAYVIAIVGGVVGVVTTPSSGADFEVQDGQLVITAFESGSVLWSEGAREGDIVELINGEPAVAAFLAGDRIEDAAVRPAGSQPGQDLNSINVISSPASMIDDLVILNILGLSFVLIAVLIYLRATQTTSTVLFAFMGLATGISLAIGPASLANQTWGRIAMGAALYIGSITFLVFFYWFTRPESSRSAGARNWMPEATALFALVVASPWVLTLSSGIDLFPLLRPGMFLLMALALLGSIVMLAYRLRTADREDQEQLRIVTLGAVIGMIPLLWLTVIPQIVSGSQIFSGEITVAGLLLVPITFGYAIAKHDLMGIRRLFHRGAAYAIISAAIIMIYGTVLTGLNLLAPDSDALGPIQGALLVLMFAGAPTLTSVRRTALRIVDRVLYEGAVTQEDLVSAISTVSANENDPERALNRAISFTGQGFSVEYAALVHFSEDGQTVPHSYNDPSPEIVKGLLAVSKPDSRRVRRSVLPGTEQTVLVGSLRQVGGDTRAIVLGPKVSEDIFSDEEVSLFETVTAVVSTALTRIHLIGEVREQSEQLKNMGTQMQNIQEIERQELSAYLHDEPLQKLAYIASRIRDMDVSEDFKSLLDDVVRDLRGTSAGLSPEMLRDHGLMTALKWVVQDQQQRGPFKVFLEVQGMEEDDRLADDVELTVYRATQEALNNCRKHAKAKSVWIKLNRTRLQLELAVEDNGVGIKANAEEQAERRPDQGLGIRGLKRRVTDLGGSMEVVPRPSRGTAFIVRIPLEEEEIGKAS